MKVVVLGGSGRAGSEIAHELAARGHVVTAIARNAEAIVEIAGVTAVAGDAADPQALADLIRGHDAVVSALHFDITADVLLTAVKQAGVGRLLITGGAASLETADGGRLIDSPAFPDEYREAALGGIAFLDALRQEKDIDWTFFSPAAYIFEGPRLGTFRLRTDRLITDADGNSAISFADFAIAMVDELEEHRHSRARFTAAY